MPAQQNPIARIAQPNRGAIPHARADEGWRVLLLGLVRSLHHGLCGYFREAPPVFANAFVPALIVSALLYTRSPLANCIFDEQEAILANPYVNGHTLRWVDAVHRDFWGLLPTRSIGSYRPLPNLIWRALWPLGNSPWLLHWVNVVVHALTAALIVSFVWAAVQRRRLAWFSGATYVCFALLTEAVSGVVGLADVLSALTLMLAIHALRLPLYAMVPGVFVSTLLGLFSKESGLVSVPLVALAALYLSPAMHRLRPLSLLRALLAGVSATAALVLYTELRKRWFPVEAMTELALADASSSSWLLRAFQRFLHWFRQPRLPADAMNNPLSAAEFPYRVAGALRIYASGLLQLGFPYRLSADYSFPAELAPTKLVSGGSVVGSLLLLVPPLVSLSGWFVVIAVGGRSKEGAAQTDVARLVLLGLIWVPVAYFPHSNIPTILPTVRAERFWVLPAIGAAMLLGAAFDGLLSQPRKTARNVAKWGIVSWFLIQVFQARNHAFDYADDLAFWGATAKAVPNSAKARLNYGVMLGARQRYEERLVEGLAAIRLAPRWPMAHVYHGDTLCRMKRVEAAWPYYRRGFELGKNEQHLIALGLQCLWDHQGILPHRSELEELARNAPGSWLSYLVYDILENGEEHQGVDPQYRPRGYNEGPKKP